MWGHIKALTYSTEKPNSREQSMKKVHAAFYKKKNNADNYSSVITILLK